MQKSVKIAQGDGIFALLNHVLTVRAVNAQTYTEQLPSFYI